MKLSALNIPRYYVSSEHKPVYATRERQNTATGRELPRSGNSQVTEGGTRSLIHWLLDQTQSIVSYCYVVTRWALSNIANLSVFKSAFVPILTYGHESWVINERTDDHLKRIRPRWDSCEEFMARHLEQSAQL